jgi:hypothetical protein
MGNLVSAHPRPPRSRRRSRASSSQHHGQRRASAAAAGLVAPPAQVLLAAIATSGDPQQQQQPPPPPGGGGAYAAFARALAALPPSAAALVCRQDPRLVHAAAASGDLRVLRAILDRGGSPALPSPALGCAPLHAASTAAGARLLVSSGGNAFLADARGRTPADVAGRGIVAPNSGGGGSGGAAASAAAALVRALEAGAPFAGRAAILCSNGGGGGSGGGGGGGVGGGLGASFYGRRRRDRHYDSDDGPRQQQQQQQRWVEAWVVVSPVYESRPFGASPARAALSAELRAYAVPQYAASAADTLPLASPAPFLRVPLDGCRVEREAEDAAGGVGGGARPGGAAVRLLVLRGDPRCVLPKRWRAEDEDERAAGSGGGGGGGGGGVSGVHVLRLRPSVAAEGAPSQSFRRLIALCRDPSLRESAAAAAAAGGVAAIAVAGAGGADSSAAAEAAADASSSAAPTIPLPPPDVMAAVEANEILLDEGEAGGGGEEGRCLVCWAAKATMALAHGGTAHVCACARCARRLATSHTPSCPVCRQPVREVLAVYYSEV